MQQLEDLTERLLREGVARRHVRRFLSELRDHVEDVARVETAQGASPAEARERAQERMGTAEDLAQEMIARPELRALGARFPKLWGVAGPVILWFGVVVAIMLSILGAAKGFEILDYGSPQLARFQGAADIFMFLFLRGLPVVVGGIVLSTALRQRLSLTWPLVGIALVAVLGACSNAMIQFALTPDTRGELSFGIGFSVQDAGKVAARVVVMFGLMLAPLAVRERLTRLAA